MLPQHKQSALHPYQLEDSLFCLMLSLYTTLHIPCSHSVGRSMDNAYYRGMNLPSFWHLVFCSCPLHQQLHILKDTQANFKKKLCNQKKSKQTAIKVSQFLALPAEVRTFKSESVHVSYDILTAVVLSSEQTRNQSGTKVDDLRPCDTG